MELYLPGVFFALHWVKVKEFVQAFLLLRSPNKACCMKTHTFQEPPSSLPSSFPSFHRAAATPNYSEVELITLMTFQLFALVLCRGQKRGEIKSGRHIKPNAIDIKIILIAWGAPPPFCYSAVMCKSCSDQDLLGRSKKAERRAGSFKPEARRPNEI